MSTEKPRMGRPPKDGPPTRHTAMRIYERDVARFRSAMADDGLTQAEEMAALLDRREAATAPGQAHQQ